MDSQQRLEDNYLCDKKRLAEKEERLYQQKNKGMQALDAIAEASHFYLKDFAPDTMDIRRGMHQLEEIKEELAVQHRKEQQRLDYEMEELTLNYRRQQRTSNEQEASL
ncbi:hypothetical protein [Listeria booriae]|uniref:hypothetical protein n=1 Tax=Listeria booriae TaxID=1552123 RepID=UPI00163D7318|nr:hypothetical protein [Listeria booriae]MBC1309181.1 hypothetical protein [Listeria booriae]